MIRSIARKAKYAALSGAVVVVPHAVTAQSADGIFERPDRPTLNFYGVPGLIDLPSAEALPDGQVAVGVSYFGGITRTTLTFQATPRIQASFRYSALEDLNLAGFSTFRDRSFDVRFLVNKESLYLPAVTVGLQDIAGTGIFSGEFIAATKTFEGGRIPGRIKATAGLGWGRLGSSGSIGSPFGARTASFDPGDTGGELSTSQWFRGEAAPFAGVEWNVNDKFGLKVEYSSDAYTLETSSGVFDRESRFNFGAEYQISDSVRLGGYYLYGSELGVNLQIQLNPKRPVSPLRIPAPRPYFIRPSRSADPEAYSTEWAASEAEASVQVRDALVPLLKAEGLTLIETHTTASETEVRFSNERYLATSIAVGRVARVMARLLPDSVETFRIVPVKNGLAQSAVVFRRSDLEALEVSPAGPDALLAVTGFSDATPTLAGGVHSEATYNKFNWSIGPYLARRFFDPNEPIRVDAGLSLSASYEPAPGWKVAGTIRHRLTGNIEDALEDSGSALPRVRTSQLDYERGGATFIPELYGSRQWKLSPDVYARVTAGYLERIFGGVSTEVLWKPSTSRLALGVEANYVQQRDFDDILGFQDYDVATGHASAYYEFNNGYLGQLDVGRYLAGDYGATVTLEREFANGWRVGGFFTLTDVSSEDFGEGSFDKGIKLTVPVNWLLGNPDNRVRSTTIRPVQRDGGARLNVPGRLYEQVRSGHRTRLSENWSGVWE
ncbi:MAG: YjbH domain-containing protein [Sulfitobacter sp.]